MKNYVKIVLYAYPLLRTIEKDYEEHIRNRAILSYRHTAERTAEYLAEEIICMRRLEWLKGRIEEILVSLTEEEKAFAEVRYFGRIKRLQALQEQGKNWTERTYFRQQARLGEKLASLLVLAGVTEEVYAREFAAMELFSKIQRCVEEGKDRKISANERRWLG